jgi:hypothetical protein
MPDFIPTFMTPSNVKTLCQHWRHMPGAYRTSRLPYGRWHFPLPTGEVYRPKLIHEAMPIPDRKDWPQLIAKKTAERSWLRDVLQDIPGNPIQGDQGREGTCWLWGPGRALNAAWCLATGASIKLAPTSLGEIFGWDIGSGGDPAQALQGLVTHGIARFDLCQPPWSYDHRQWNAGWKADCANHKIVNGHLIDGMTSNSFDAAAAFAFNNVASSCGYSAMSHEFFGCVQVVDLQQASAAVVQAAEDAGVFQHVPEDIVLGRPDFLEKPRFQVVCWNQWGTDHQWLAWSYGPDIDNTGISCTTAPQ